MNALDYFYDYILRMKYFKGLFNVCTFQKSLEILHSWDLQVLSMWSKEQDS